MAFAFNVACSIHLVCPFSGSCRFSRYFPLFSVSSFLRFFGFSISHQSYSHSSLPRVLVFHYFFHSARFTSCVGAVKNRISPMCMYVCTCLDSSGGRGWGRACLNPSITFCLIRLPIYVFYQFCILTGFFPVELSLIHYPI